MSIPIRFTLTEEVFESLRKTGKAAFKVGEQEYLLTKGLSNEEVANILTEDDYTYLKDEVERLEDKVEELEKQLPNETQEASTEFIFKDEPPKGTMA